jgi:hypothetical protein
LTEASDKRTKTHVLEKCENSSTHSNFPSHLGLPYISVTQNNLQKSKEIKALIPRILFLFQCMHIRPPHSHHLGLSVNPWRHGFYPNAEEIGVKFLQLGRDSTSLTSDLQQTPM